MKDLTPVALVVGSVAIVILEIVCLKSFWTIISLLFVADNVKK